MEPRIRVPEASSLGRLPSLRPQQSGLAVVQLTRGQCRMEIRRSRSKVGIPDAEHGASAKKMRQTSDYDPPSREERCIRSYAEAPYSAGLSGPKRPSPVPGWFHPGQSMCVWCGRGDLNPHDLLGSADFHTTSAFAASLREFVVWTIPSPFPARGLGAAHLVSTPSRKHPGLARDCHSRFPRL